MKRIAIRLEVHARAQLQEALLPLERVAGVLGRLTEGRRIRDVAAETGWVLRVEDVKYLGQDLDAETSGDDEVLGEAQIELREAVPASLVDVSDAGR